MVTLIYICSFKITVISGTSLAVQCLKFAFQCRGCIQSLVGELRFHMPLGQKTWTLSNRSNIVTKSIRLQKWSTFLKKSLNINKRFKLKKNTAVCAKTGELKLFSSYSQANKNTEGTKPTTCSRDWKTHSSKTLPVVFGSGVALWLQLAQSEILLRWFGKVTKNQIVCPLRIWGAVLLS